MNGKERLRRLVRHNPAARAARGVLVGAGHAARAAGGGRQVWAFNAGDYFTGNPKWLFFYVNRYRPEIRAYWICDQPQTVERVRKLGFEAWTYSSPTGIFLQARTDVFCVEAVKEKLSAYFPEDMVCLNLFHGVGCKPIEKQLRYGYLVEKVAAKYIRYNAYLQRNMKFLVTSPLMEEHFAKQLGLREEMVIRGGYPRCLYQQVCEPVSTFDHDLIRARQLPADTRIAAYVPTFRDDPSYDFWGNALPDMELLTDRLRRERILLIIKPHPHMERDGRFRKLREDWGSCPWLLFWNNENDLYEIFPKIDIGIFDYSSIFYDMLSGGVKHFIRYFFDYADGENMRDFVFDIREMTCGTMCESFAQLLAALGGDLKEEREEEERSRIMELFWSYAAPDSMDRIVDAGEAGPPAPGPELKTLYSFSVFGTLLRESAGDGGRVRYAPVRKNLSRLEKLAAEGQTVVLLCHRPMERKKLLRLLERAGCAAAGLPLFIARADASGAKQLYLDAYLGFDSYNFKEWIHFGRDPEADGSVPRELGIKTCLS